MIKKKIFAGEKTNKNGELELKFSFTGYLLEIDIDYGSLGMDTKTTITTSNGREIAIEGNDSTLFPIAPRKSFNEDKYYQNIGVETASFEKYPNAGEMVIRFENADTNKTLKKLEIIYEI